MNTFLDGLLIWNITIQSWGEWLSAPMAFFSFLGQEEFFLLIMPGLYWCWDASIGLRVGVMLLLSGGINNVFKIAFHSPRPYWFDQRVFPYAHESSFGLPSGHAQNAVSVWGALAVSIRRKWAWIAAFIIMFLIGFSRLYVGVHFLHDVLVGWLIGGLLLWGLICFEKPIKERMASKPVGAQIIVVLLVSLCLVILGAALKMSLVNWQPPPDWGQNANAGVVDPEPFTPVAASMEGLLTSTGAFFGLAAGAIWLNARAGFNASGKVLQLITRYIIGLVGVVLLWRGLGMLFPGGDTFLAYSLRYFRYALIGFWISAGAPSLFIRWGLAGPSGSASPS
jgi:membrane-associated phospholipid phosphatase